MICGIKKIVIQKVKERRTPTTPRMLARAIRLELGLSPSLTLEFLVYLNQCIKKEIFWIHWWPKSDQCNTTCHQQAKSTGPLSHSYNSQHWTRPKPGSQNFIWFSHMEDRGPSAWAVFSPGTSAGSRIRSRGGGAQLQALQCRAQASQMHLNHSQCPSAPIPCCSKWFAWFFFSLTESNLESPFGIYSKLVPQAPMLKPLM